MKEDTEAKEQSSSKACFSSNSAKTLKMIASHQTLTETGHIIEQSPQHIAIAMSKNGAEARSNLSQCL